MTASRPEAALPKPTDSRARLVLAVPDLEALCAEAQHPPAVLSRILARAREQGAESDLPLAEALGLDPVPAPAALSRLASRAPDADPDPEAVWMRADVVALVPDLTAVWVRGPAAWPESARRDMQTAVSELFADEELEYFAGDDGQGHLRLPAMPDCRFQPPGRIAGRRLDEVLPTGAEEKTWRRRINESQMLLHSFSGHSSAAETGTLGLWFWGAGRLGAAPTPWPELVMDPGDDPVMQGLARWIGANVRKLPEWSPGPGPRVVHWRADPGREADANLQDLARQWLTPAWQALRRRHLHALVLVGEFGWHELSPAGAWKFWRSRPAAPETPQ